MFITRRNIDACIHGAEIAKPLNGKAHFFGGEVGSAPYALGISKNTVVHKFVKQISVAYFLKEFLLDILHTLAVLRSEIRKDNVKVTILRQ